VASWVIRSNVKQFQQAMAERPKDLFLEWFRTTNRLMDRFDKTFKRKSLQGRPGLIPRTRRLIRSFHSVVRGRSIGTLRVNYGSNVLYAPVHEFGAVIYPRRAPYLVFREDPKGSRIQRMARTGRIPVRQTREGRELGPLIFAKKVTVPARLNFRRQWRQFQPVIVRELSRATTRVLQSRKSGGSSRSFFTGV